MSDELKACPFCGNQSAVMDWLPSLSGIVEYPFCEYCGAQCETAELWNTRPIEDGLRAELAAAQAEVERLREIIRGTEWVLSADEYDPPKETIVVQYECAICHFVYFDNPGEHSEICPFYQWEGGAK